MGFIGIALICVGLCIIGIIIPDDNTPTDFKVGTAIVSTFISGIGAGILILAICFPNEGPKAIDVYRNKTTLQITYKNEIPVDTVVVFK